MDAVSLSCAGVAPRSALLSHPHSFADAAIARALHFSLSDHAAAEPPPPMAAATTAAAMLMHGAVAGTDCAPNGAAPSSSARCRLGPAGGHAGKRRRQRPSKRAPTTYISTDAATFRAMVQRVTGADEADLQPPPQMQDGLGIGLLLPHLGVEQFLQAAGHAPTHVAAAAPYATAPPAASAEQQQPPPLFPTLDSWNVMYGKKNEVVSALTAGP